MGTRSLRCVALAYRNYDKDGIPVNEGQPTEWNLPEDDLVLLAIVGIKDPCRPGVKNEVKVCTDAGVKVRMVTGDNIQMAKSITIECGILASGEDVIGHMNLESIISTCKIRENKGK
ncbi:calcium-transporting ATPase 9, plasma membrane-type protein [Tanacetum coccineum]